MITFDRTAVKIVASAGLCALAVALSPHAAATPLKTGGYKCLDQSAGAAPAVAAAPCAAAAVEAAGVAAPLAPPVPVVPPVGGPPLVPPLGVPPVPPVAPPLGVPPVPPVPLAPPVPVAGPIAAVPVGAPITTMDGVASGKGVPTVGPGGGPSAGVPTPAGPNN